MFFFGECGWIRMDLRFQNSQTPPDPPPSPQSPPVFSGIQLQIKMTIPSLVHRERDLFWALNYMLSPCLMQKTCCLLETIDRYLSDLDGLTKAWAWFDAWICLNHLKNLTFTHFILPLDSNLGDQIYFSSLQNTILNAFLSQPSSKTWETSINETDKMK